MSIEKVREAVRLRLEELYDGELEFQEILSQIVIPFSEFFTKPRSSELNLVNKDLPFSKWDKEYKEILLKEL
ncbi:MAG: hypothetical protein KGD67_03790 [Candidatus Lokiarchaeota archaeon]|nr:hypothetical protein [Candidatus Lokiarchaeota archaeon]